MSFVSCIASHFEIRVEHWDGDQEVINAGRILPEFGRNK